MHGIRTRLEVGFRDRARIRGKYPLAWICLIRHTVRIVDEPHIINSIVWVGSSLKDLRSFPAEVKDVMGYALYQAQVGRKAPSAKPLSGFRGSSVIEIVEDYQSDTYRAVYTVRFSGVVYVLHVFQKKSKKGIAMPRLDMELIRKRLKAAEEDYRERETENCHR